MNSGPQDLLILDLSLDDAGRYECWDSFEESFSAQLIVIGKRQYDEVYY